MELSYINFNMVDKNSTMYHWVGYFRSTNCSQLLTDWAPSGGTYDTQVPSGGNQNTVVPPAGRQVVIKQRKSQICEESYRNSNLTMDITLPN